MKISKWVIIILSTLLVLSVGVFTIFSGYKGKANLSGGIQRKAAVEKKTDLIINFGDDKIAIYSALYGNTVYDVLKNAEQELITSHFDFGVLVSKIKGYENNTDYAWIYYVNGVAGEVAADKYELQDGDKVEWRYVKIQN